MKPIDVSQGYETMERRTAETAVSARLALRPGRISVRTGLGFLDHMFSQLCFHAGWSLDLSCAGDLEVDDHHSAEDSSIVLGTVLRAAIQKRMLPAACRMQRFGTAYAPMDEALARAVVDLSGRPLAVVDLGLRQDRLGSLATENLAHALRSFAAGLAATIHCSVLYGENDHHRAEAAFKAMGLALCEAIQWRPADGPVASTKGLL